MGSQVIEESYPTFCESAAEVRQVILNSANFKYQLSSIFDWSSLDIYFIYVLFDRDRCNIYIIKSGEKTRVMPVI